MDLTLKKMIPIRFRTIKWLIERIPKEANDMELVITFDDYGYKCRYIGSFVDKNNKIVFSCYGLSLKSMLISLYIKTRELIQ